MMTNPNICKHPLIYLHSNDTRYYCPDCGKFIYGYKPPNIIIGIDPVSGNDPVSVLKVHPDGTLENMMYRMPSIEEIQEELTKMSGVPKRYLGSD